MTSSMQNDKNDGRLRAVLDTNVLFSAYRFPPGALADIRQALEDGRFLLVFSPALASELGEILRRFHWSDQNTHTLIRLLARKALLVHPEAIPDAVPNDPDDNQIIACALEGRADVIVSGDRHLLALGEYEGIPIVRPMDFLRMVSGPKE